MPLPELQEIQKWLFNLLNNQGFELHSLDLKPRDDNWLLQVFIDHPNGITLENCAAVSRQLSIGLDTKGFLEQEYTLEVSSPGTGQELHQAKDWEKSLGKFIKVYCIDDQEVIGIFQGTQDSVVNIMAQEGLKQLAKTQIRRAKLYPLGFFDF